MITSDAFCVWDCVSDLAAFIIILYTVIAIVLVIYCVRTYLKIMKYMSNGEGDNKEIQNMFIAMFAWGVGFIGISIFSLFAYLLVFRDHLLDQNDPQRKLKITKYSKIYSFIQTIPAFIIQSLLIITARTMMTNVMAILIDRHILPSSWQGMLYKFINRYIVVRYAYIPFSAFIFIFQNHHLNELQIFTQIKISLMLLDCMISALLLVHCNKYMRKNCLSLLSKRRQRAALMNQTRMLIFCSFCRLFFDLVNYLLLPFYYEKIQPKNLLCFQDVDQYSLSYPFYFGYLFFGTYLLHHLPIYFLIQIHNPTQIKSFLNQSTCTTIITSVTGQDHPSS